MPAFVRELGQGFRLWIRQPLFFLTSIAVLAVGLGATLTIFTVVNGLLLRPVSPDHPERLVGIYSRDTTQPDSYRAFSYPNYRDVAGAKAIFDEVLAHAPAMVGLTEGDSTRRVFVDFVTANFFRTMGGRPLVVGRAFTEAEAAPGSDAAICVISDTLFRRLGRPGDVLTRTLRLNGRDYTIVGIAAPWFTGSTAVASPELWLPLGAFDRNTSEVRPDTPRLPLSDRANHALFLIGRLKPRVSVADANGVLANLSSRMAVDQPDINAHQELSAYPAARLSISTHPPAESSITIAGILLLAVATVVLVIACLNAATLILSRGMAQRRNVAIRLALGAPRARIVAQLLAEGFVLASIACAAGMVVASRAAQVIVGTIQALAPLPVVFSSTPDARTVFTAVGLTAFSTIVFGLGPAIKLTRADVIDDLQRRPVFAAQGRRRRVFSGTNLLVIAQLALSLVLLTTAGLFIRGAANSIAAPLGFALDGELVAMVDATLGGATVDRARRQNLEAVERVRSMPGALSATLASTIPFGDTREAAAMAATPTTKRQEMTRAAFTVIGRDYFRTLGIALVSGREFTAAEEVSKPAASVAVIDQLAAKRLWPGEDPIGRTMYLVRRESQADPVTVVGVVGTTRLDLVDQPGPAVYVPFGQEPRTTVAVHVRVAPGAETSSLALLRARLDSVDRAFPILKLASLRTVRDESASMWLVTTSGRIFGALGTLAGLLAIVGLYAVVAYVVSRRVKEIGIRIAIGATQRDVVLMVLRDGAALAGIGLAFGFLLALGAAQVIRAVAAAVAVADLTVFAVPPFLLAAAALAASAVPAWRAARLQPLVALREE